MKRLSAILLTLVCGLPAATFGAVAYTDAAGRQWRQPADTLGLTWFDVAPVCSVDTGVCTGSAGGIDVDGWMWADVATVNELFRELSGGAGFPTPEPQEYEVFESTWAPGLIDTDGAGPDVGIFDMTVEFAGSDQRVLGWTRDKDPDPATGAYLGRIDDTPTFDKLQTDDRSDIDQENPAIVGFWLYQNTTPVPVPAALWLLAAPLLALARRDRGRPAASTC
ncbi:MAG: hypothetical protein AB7Q81_22725 [Gammaproteobacteria bacterium]